MQKWWSLLFGAVLAATFLIWLVAPLMGWWLPTNVSSFGPDVDYLFYVILVLTGFFFLLTEGLLVYAMYRFAYRPGHKATYVEGNHRLEIAWTVVPGAILIFIALAQVKAWEVIKYPSRMEQPHQVIQLTARQWDWRFRYPADTGRFGQVQGDSPEESRRKLGEARSWAEHPESDDLYLPAELHVWKDANVRVYLKTQDVLHSFYMPNLRLKQDALPGKTIPVWFRITQSNTKFNPDRPGPYCDDTQGENDWEIACAELCGGGHYRMRGRVYVHPDREDFERWHRHLLDRQRSREPDPTRSKSGTVALGK